MVVFIQKNIILSYPEIHPREPIRHRFQLAQVVRGYLLGLPFDAGHTLASETILNPPPAFVWLQSAYMALPRPIINRGSFGQGSGLRASATAGGGATTPISLTLGARWEF